MNQEEVKVDLLSKGCYVYKTKKKEDGNYFFMRKIGTKKMATVYPPKGGTYTKAAAYHIYKTLEVLPPAFCLDAKEVVEKATASANLLDSFKDPPSDN